MAIHIFKYKLKCFLKDRQMIFWTFLFPILLATLFNMAFGNLSSIDNFLRVKVAVVNNQKYQDDKNFIKVIKDASKQNAKKTENQMFSVMLTDDKKQADALLEDNKVDGYIWVDKKINLVVKQSGINQTILKSFLDQYSQTTKAVYQIIEKNPATIQNGFLNQVKEHNEYLKDEPLSKSTPNSTVVYFYALIAMASLYGGFWGLRVVTEVQADLSSKGARVNVAPVHKLKLLLCDTLAVLLIQFVEVLLVILYIGFVLKYDFGNQWGYIILNAFAGSLTGITFGTFIGAVVKKSEGTRVGVLLGSSMLMSFFAGMMSIQIKYLVSNAFPPIAWLNPANLITDGFYALYYFDSHQRFFTNVACLFGFSILFSVIAYLSLRRRKYASI